MRQPLFRKPGIVFLVLVVLGFVCLPLDVSLARMMLNDATPGELRGLFRRAEVFGHGYGIAAVVCTIFLLSPSNRSAIPRLIFNCLVAGLSADVLKLFVWRTRPRTYELLESHGHTFLGTILTTPGCSWTEITESSRHSFPSAHTATAVAMAITLSKLYPAGRWWFVTLAFLCAMNRIDGGAHYASDVCWGAALGIAVLHCCYRSQQINRFFARWEKESDRSAAAPTVSYRKSA